jgi:hypothetical protein
MIDIPQDTIVDADGNVVHGPRNPPIASIYQSLVPFKGGHYWEGCTYGFKAPVGKYTLKSICGDWEIEVYRVSGEEWGHKAHFFGSPLGGRFSRETNDPDQVLEVDT